MGGGTPRGEKRCEGTRDHGARGRGVAARGGQRRAAACRMGRSGARGRGIMARGAGGRSARCGGELREGRWGAHGAGGGKRRGRCVRRGVRPRRVWHEER
ncbi:hypothetical protein PVAP13_5KG163307 [Panicum virgatum]|uniref:Uncharacterized protein n=1 Tax=Panicum virgatum TaxID=38727 RepID=A0A8T0SH96_PANVG|nr:hypothetical protein PVAP13_5KG163307 [Panicum virgatum]